MMPKLKGKLEELKSKLDIIKSKAKIPSGDLTKLVNLVKKTGYVPQKIAFDYIFGKRKRLSFDFSTFDYGSPEENLQAVKPEGFTEKDLQAYNYVTRLLYQIEGIMRKIMAVKDDISDMPN